MDRQQATENEAECIFDGLRLGKNQEKGED